MADIFSEVEEEVRKERWEQLWKRFGTLFILAAGAVVVSVAGWQAWQRYDQAQRESASLQFNNAMNVAQAGNVPQAESDLMTFVAEAPAGYEKLAEFQLAKTQIDQGKRDAAIANLRNLITDPSPLISSPARLQLAWILAETNPREEVEALVAPLKAAQNPWRFAAAEVSAYLEYHAGNLDQAAAAYQALAIDPGVAEGTAQRARAIAQFLPANALPTTNTPIAGETENPDGETVRPEASDQEAPQ